MCSSVVTGGYCVLLLCSNFIVLRLLCKTAPALPCPRFPSLLSISSHTHTHTHTHTVRTCLNHRPTHTQTYTHTHTHTNILQLVVFQRCGRTLAHRNVNHGRGTQQSIDQCRERGRRRNRGNRRGKQRDVERERVTQRGTEKERGNENEREGKKKTRQGTCAFD